MSISGLRGAVAVVLMTVAASGCGQGDTDEAPVETAPGIADLAPGWTAVQPGGNTTCSDGTPYQFFVRPGDPQKLMLYLQGGGGCWTRETCDPEMQPTYSMRADDSRKPRPFGIFNFDNPDNPFADYSIVMAPYCTGDVHLGASDTVYPPVQEEQSPLTIHHRGRTNVQAVLDWTYGNVPAPTQIFVTGSSAGAIPSPFYAALVADQYEGAKVAQLGDGAGGYRRMAADNRMQAQWGAFSYIDKEAGFESLTSDSYSNEALYIAAARAHPEILFAEYDAAEDAVQKRFLALGGNETAELLPLLEANHKDIRAAVPNFRSFITGGPSHTILQRPEFYSYGADGVSVRDWVADLASFQDVANVACKDCAHATYAGPPIPQALQTLWETWEDPGQQYVEPFQIFDNVYYVGINWVAAYVLETSAGLILIDSLYGSWVPPLLQNIRKLGLDPSDIRYVINTHGHFDHAGGSALLQKVYGARVVMAEQDWALAATKPDIPRFYMPVPERDIVGKDGDVIELGDTRVELLQTPGHTEGVLTLRYPVRDGDDTYTAVTLGGVGLNFSGVERTETYIDSYRRLQTMQDGVSVSLPNHAAMAGVLERGAALAQREPGEAHPFVDAAAYQASLVQFIANAEAKLEAERSGNAPDPLEALTNAVSDSE